MSVLAATSDQELQALLATRKTRTRPNCLACPTTLCVNHVIFNYAPLLHTEDRYDHVLKADDLVKVHIGVSIDGHVLEMADSFIVVSANNNNNNNNSVASIHYKRLFSALATADEALRRSIRPGLAVEEMNKLIRACCADYAVASICPAGSVVRRIESTQASDVEIKGVTKPSDLSIKSGVVYSVDIIFTSNTSGDAHLQVDETQPVTIYQRTTMNDTHRHRLPSSISAKSMFHDICTTYGDGGSHSSSSSFHLQHYAHKMATARMGIQVLHKQGIVQAHPVVVDKTGSKYCVRRKFAFLVTDKRVMMYPSFDAHVSRQAVGMLYVAPCHQLLVAALHQAFFAPPSRNKAAKLRKKLDKASSTSTSPLLPSSSM